MGHKDVQMPKIFFIDDDPSILMTLETMGDELGYEYQSFKDPTECLELLEKSRGSAVTAIICDIKMPHMSGLEFTQKAKALNEEIPIILITAFDSAQVAVDALEMGAYDYVTKPIHFKELSIILKRAINQRKIKQNVEELEKRVKNLEKPKTLLLGKSTAISHINELISQVAHTMANVLVTGETGTGKELVAKSIHQLSDRSHKNFVTINCASIPEQLLESELFGHVKGAFTDASKDKDGLFHEAQGGTLFLDEIGDMPLSLQTKLLRVLQERKLRKLGATQEIEIDVRVIAATHKNLMEMIKEKTFREDLFYRLNVINIEIPPLRERKDDIPILVDMFIKKCRKEHKSKIKNLSDEALEKLISHNWPGNVRELENTIERSCIMSSGSTIEASKIVIVNNQQKSTEQNFLNLDELKTLSEIEAKYIEHVLEEVGWVKEKASKILGINRKTLYRKIKDYGLED